MTYGGPDHEEYFGGDQWAEHEHYEANAHYDYLREAFGPEIDDYDDDGAEVAWVAPPEVYSHPVQVKPASDDDIPF